MASAQPADYDMAAPTDEAITSVCSVVDGHKMMQVNYQGVVNSVYANDEWDCQLLNIESPITFLININITAPGDCPIQKETGLEVYSIDMVVQRGAIRQVTDTVTVVTCNFEVGSDAQTVQKQTEIVDMAKKSLINNAGSALQGAIELSIHTTEGTELSNGERVVLGDYIQLRARMANTEHPDESGIRVWSCVAQAQNDPNTFYTILSGGCGDSKIIPSYRGFNTEPSGNYSVARSPFFKAFAFPGVNLIQFLCNFIICPSVLCNGPSCPKTKTTGIRSVRSVHDPSSAGHMITGGIYIITPHSPHLPTGHGLTADVLMTAGAAHDPMIKRPHACMDEVVGSPLLVGYSGPTLMTTLTLALVVAMSFLTFAILLSLIFAVMRYRHSDSSRYIRAQQCASPASTCGFSPEKAHATMFQFNPYNPTLKSTLLTP